jgi:hypothetical protein
LYSLQALFINGFITVELNGKYGAINQQGEEICEIKYDNIGLFLFDYAIVILNNKYGAIDKNGDEIIGLKYNGYEIKNVIEKYFKNKQINLKLNQLV